MKALFFTSLIFFIIQTGDLSAQDFEGKQGAFKSFFEVGRDLFSSPGRFNANDLLVAGAVLGTTAAAIPLDETIRGIALANQMPLLGSIAEADRYYHIESMVITTAAIYIYGSAADEINAKNLGVRLTEAVVYSGIITLASKIIIGRGRPSLGKSSTEFSPLNIDWDYSSLPSGHTTLSFAYSTVMAAEFNNFFWEFGWYTAASLVGIARIYHNAHWFSDVILGAAIGYFVGDFVNRHKSNSNQSGETKPVMFNFTIPLN